MLEMSSPAPQVCYKVTDFLGDQVLLAASAHGGLSEVPRDSFRTSSNAFKLVSEIGQFGHPPEVCLLVDCFTNQAGHALGPSCRMHSQSEFKMHCQLVHEDSCLNEAYFRR